VFAPYAPTIQDHLGRLQLADIALDTAPYNSHSTGVDALWCGVPLVCLRGSASRDGWRRASSPPRRAGARGRHARGLPPLALALATDADALRAMKSRLEDARSRAPLFDTAGFARDLEALYLRIRESHRAGSTATIQPAGAGA